jgi:spermidine synthase
MFICAAIAWSAMLTQSMPYWPVNPSITTDPWFNFQLDFVRCLWVVLPGAILWGASFPLALASVASEDEDPARVVGGVYAANTLGAIVGSLGSSLLLTVWLGSQRSQQLLVIIAALSGLLVRPPAAKRRPQAAVRRHRARDRGGRRRRPVVAHRAAPSRHLRGTGATRPRGSGRPR